MNATNGRTDDASYARLSMDRDESESVESQLEDCRAWYAERGVTDAREFVDPDVSASRYSRKPRKGYEELLAAIRSGDVRRLLVWKLDRLYRKPRELEDLIDLAETHRVQVVTVMGGELDLNTSQGRATARGMVTADAKASDDTSERVKRRKLKDRQAGRPSGGPRPFGWESDQRTPHRIESRVLLAAMERILAGASLNDIAREWTADEVRGRKWNTSDIHRTLTMPRHAGLIVHQGQVVGAGQWEPLVSRERWERVCAAVQTRARNAGVPRRRSMLTGILRCGTCGAAMSKSTNVRGARVWRCDPATHRPGCGRVSIVAVPVERLILDALFEYVDGLELAELIRDGGDASEHAGLATALAELDQQEDESAAAYARRAITLRQMEAITADLRSQRQALRARMARAAKVDSLQEYAGQPGALEAAWKRLTDDQKRGIIADAFGEVTILPASKLGREFDRTRVLLGRDPSSS